MKTPCSRAPVREIGGCELRVTAAGGADPLLAGFPAHFPTFQWHGDTFDVPDGAVLLAEGTACRNQLFRRGPVDGAQLHLEVASAEAAAWADAYAAELAEVGKSRDQVVAECRAREAEMATLAARLVHNFLHLPARS